MRITIVGHSHLRCMKHAILDNKSDSSFTYDFLQLHKFKKDHMPGSLNLSVHNVDIPQVTNSVISGTKDSSAVVLSVTGNAPAIFGLKKFRQDHGANKGEKLSSSIENGLMEYVSAYNEWLALLNKLISVPIFVLPPPPPVGNNDLIQKSPGQFKEVFERAGISSPEFRLKIYEFWLGCIRESALNNGMQFIELPDDVFVESSFLAERYYGGDPSHANVDYGARIISYLFSKIESPGFAKPNAGATTESKKMTKSAAAKAHPYSALPDTSFWKQAVSQVPRAHFDPVAEVPFKISHNDKVATAGSCFAQHISRQIRKGGFQFLVTERPIDPGDDGNERGFYDFTARYGNIYTTRQLLQLFDRAFDSFVPVEDHWVLPEGTYCDPFRPRIEPEGFSSIKALDEDRKHHLEAVREMFEELDIFVFTLGLTESWMSRSDGAVYPVAPGVAGGHFDPLKYEFVNFDVNEVIADLKLFIHKLRLVNPKAKLILTVSPVPLTATYEPNNVLVSTTYSKSVLRVAVDMVSRSCEGVYYFPSYEIITGNFNRGRYFGQDLRSVTMEGVEHVMSVFMRHLTEGGSTSHSIAAPLDAGAELDEDAEEMMALAEAACDDELLERE